MKESLKTACEGKANVSKAFIDTVFLQQLTPVVLNEVRYVQEREYACADYNQRPLVLVIIRVILSSCM